MDLNILITGSEGYIGQRLISALEDNYKIVGVDIRPPSIQLYPYYEMDIRDTQLSDIMAKHLSLIHI